ncbi:DNA polymerase [Peptococcaceae bacterium SCADC1_2_3]|jgi:predicted nucleotidyltransferase|nr:DNA polymerase [Peptococcaceae bacterium SCADC1_2_3]KFI34388.1 DNA polymerase [Peptococcaceae bacterium SCADC1_2_3]
MSVVAQIKSKRGQILNIASQHGVNKVKIFGSALRGEETPESGIDLLVECKDECSLFDLIGLKQELEQMFGRKINIVTPNSIHWSLQESILREAQEI